ncbi:MAG: tetratricopeptide repeat protein [Kangiellaceae bacterium]
MKQNNSNPLMEQISQAVQCHQSGDLIKAKSLYSKILKKDKLNPQVNHLLGLLYLQLNKNSKAVNSLKRAHSLQPLELTFITSLANAYFTLEALEELKLLVEHCQKRNIQQTAISLKLANLYAKKNQLQPAIKLFRSLIEVEQSNWNLWLEFGNCTFLNGDLKQANDCYLAVLRINPNQVDALSNLAAISIERKDFDSASNYIEQALANQPKHLVARYNYANICYQRGEHPKALDVLRELHEEAPNYIDVAILMAKSERRLGNFSSAIAILNALIKLNAKNDVVLNEIANCYFELKEFSVAIEYFAHAVSINSENVDARFNLAICSTQLRDYENAVKEFSLLVTLKADYFTAYAPYLHVLRQSCLWEETKQIEAKLRHLLDSNPEVNIPPFSMITLESSDSDEQVKVANHWVTRQLPAYDENPLLRNTLLETDDTAEPSEDIKNRRIRVGYFSSDFHEHATAILLVRVLELHDTNRFECFAYSYGPDDQSDLRQRVMHSVEHFRDLFNSTKQQMIESIKADRLDVLLDLKGFTQGSMSEILLAKLAPIQINYLGYPGSMSKQLVDYIIVDQFILDSEKVRFDEATLTLPNCYQPTDDQRVLENKPARESLGLSEQQFVFAAFHQGYKLNPKMLETWVHILKSCPSSVLWCLTLSETAKRVVKKYFESFGLELHRIVFADKLSPKEHITRLQCADLALDTFPVNGHTTTSDALWAGVPVVTIAGDTFISRVAGSLLNAANLGEFVCEDHLDYQKKAIDCYNNRHELTQLKERLVKEKSKLSLFDSKQYTRDLESILYKVVIDKN